MKRTNHEALRSSILSELRVYEELLTKKGEEFSKYLETVKSLRMAFKSEQNIQPLADRLIKFHQECSIALLQHFLEKNQEIQTLLKREKCSSLSELTKMKDE